MSIDYKEKKVRIQAWISDEIDAKFRKFIQQKYKKYERGLLSYEVESALQAWIIQHTNSQTQLDIKIKPNPTPSSARVYREVKAYISGHYDVEFTGNTQLHEKFIIEAITTLRGNDPRTIKSWMQTFERMGLIKILARPMWEMT